MKFNILYITLFFSFHVLGQEKFRENLWSSLSVKQILPHQFNLTLDLGYRTCDEFIKSKRTVLGRILVEKTFREQHGIGVGYALFDHYNGNRNLEKRPFIHYQFQSGWKEFKFGVRFRNEFRFFSANNVSTNRSRLQISVRYNGIRSCLQPGISIEGFVTPGDQSLYEQRYTASVFSQFSDHFTTHFFFTLQRQSTVNVNQNIIGIQLQITLNGSNNK